MSAKRLIIHTDGASRGNPGPAAIGVVIRDEQGRVIAKISEAIGRTTNNRAEYFALIAGLEEALRLGAERVDLRMDSELIVRQLTGQYRVRNPALKPLFAEAFQLLRKFQSSSIQHIPREHNREADALTRHALRKAGS
ncbi:MAG: reverse transcriptase-like protein [Dehalococcoidia bacterium]|nr:reverse transcriptase-like protein [Dehalococcoidia bacterium]